MREIVTIQVGEFANFVGSHFWNFQDELLGLADDPESDPIFTNQSLNMDALYRAGETQQGVATYTPRLVSINFQGSLGSMSSHGTLYNEASSAKSDISTWSGHVSTYASEPRKRNLFLQSLYEEEQGKIRGGKNENASKIQDKDIVECLDKGVECWTDFSKVHYHPQSLYELSGLWMGSQDFDNYGIGRDVFSEGLRGEEICERLRFFVEECDHIQGIQFIVDDSGGFSAVAADFLESIADEYTNVPVLLYSVRSPISQMKSRSLKRTVSSDLHDAVSFSRLSSFCKLFIPVGLPSLNGNKVSKYLFLENEKPYSTSAVYAAALHSNTITFRMEQMGFALDSRDVSGAMDVNTLVQTLAGQGRQNMVAILDAAMPAPALKGKQLDDMLVTHLLPLTPEVAEDVEDMQAVECMSVLGALGSEGKEASVSEVKNAVHASYEHTIARPLFSHLSVSRCPLPIPLPFPSIFGNLVGQKGELSSSPISDSLFRGSLDVHSIPLAAKLRSSSAILPFLESRLGNLQKYGIQWGAPGLDLVRTWGFGREELQDMRENLSKMVSALNPHFVESSDSD